MNILLIEDNIDHVFLIEEAFSQAFDNVGQVENCKLFAEGLARLTNANYDVCLCDLSLPDSLAEDTINTLQALATDTPIIVLTALDDFTLANTVIKGSVLDYIPKSELTATLFRRTCLQAVARNKREKRLTRENEEKQTFCYSLSHDFNGALRRVNSILFMLNESLTSRIDLTEDESEMFKIVHSNIKSVQGLVAGLFDYLSIENVGSDVKAVDLNKVVDLVKQNLAQSESKKHAQIIVEEVLPSIEALELQIVVMLQNIFTNAIKYNNNQPQIKVSAKLHESKNQCEIAVEDNGIGIDAKEIEKIFDPFVRSHPSGNQKGAGLGLSIVSGIVRKHGGTISVESTVGEGSKFTVTLPIRQSHYLS